jgi:hypothetical protein
LAKSGINNSHPLSCSIIDFIFDWLFWSSSPEKPSSGFDVFGIDVEWNQSRPG